MLFVIVYLIFDVSKVLECLEALCELANSGMMRGRGNEGADDRERGEQ